MPTKITITVNRVKLEAELYDTPCAQEIVKKLQSLDANKAAKLNPVDALRAEQ